MKSNLQLTTEQQKYVIDNYPTIDSKIITQYLGCTKNTLKSIVRKLGVSKLKKYTINQTFFDNWSTDMAYILGWVITDGCVRDTYHLNWGLSIKDKCVLDYISSHLAPGKPLYVCKDKVLGKYHTKIMFDIGSKYITHQLSKYHIVPRKTGKEKLPECPDKFKPDLLRGIFDGDGCIWANPTNNNKQFAICSASLPFLNSVKQYLGFGYGNIIEIKKENRNILFYWQVYKRNQIRELADYMYQNNGFCLERKKVKFYGS